MDNISKDNAELHDMIRDYTSEEQKMVEEFMADKQLVKIEGEPYAYRYE